MRTPASPSRMDLVSRPDVTPALYLVLLVFFSLFAFPEITSCYFVSLPRAETAEWLLTKGPAVQVDRNRTETYWVRWRTTLTKKPELAGAIAHAVAGREGPARVVQIYADKDAPYRDVLNVLDAAREAGVQRIDLFAEVPRRKPVR